MLHNVSKYFGIITLVHVSMGGFKVPRESRRVIYFFFYTKRTYANFPHSLKHFCRLKSKLIVKVYLIHFTIVAVKERIILICACYSIPQRILLAGEYLFCIQKAKCPVHAGSECIVSPEWCVWARLRGQIFMKPDMRNVQSW